MTYADAANYYHAMQGQQAALGSPDIGSAVGQLSKIRSLINQQPPKPKQWTFGDVIHGAIGAALGAGVAKGISAVLPISARFADKLETAAMGVGAAANLGKIKIASREMDTEDVMNAAQNMLQQRKHAFRIGFLKAAYELGWFEKEGQEKQAAFLLNVDPGGLLAIPKALANTATGGGRLLGSVAGAADAPDDTEEAITEMQVEKTLLEEQLERLRSEKRNRALRQMLARRRA